MNVLIVYAHPEPRSFNGALKDRAVAALTRAGHTVTVSDLYAMRFNPIAGPDDFAVRAEPARLNYAAEQAAAHASGTVAADIAAEQAKVDEADHLILQFPLWWYSVPAILKGWLERIMALGYTYGAGRMFNRGGMAGKRAMLSFTTHGQESAYGDDGWHGPIGNTVTPLHQGLRFVGFDVLQPFVAYNVVRASDAERQAILDVFEERVAHLASAAPLSFPPIESYDADGRLVASD